MSPFVSKSPPEMASDDAPEPARVTAAKARKPLKRSTDAVKERERKREYRAHQRQEEERAAPSPETAEVWTVKSTKALLSMMLRMTAQATGRPVLIPTDPELRECAEALTPVCRKYMPSLIGKYEEEAQALMVLGAVLGPRILAAARGDAAELKQGQVVPLKEAANAAGPA